MKYSNFYEISIYIDFTHVAKCPGMDAKVTSIQTDIQEVIHTHTYAHTCIQNTHTSTHTNTHIRHMQLVCMVKHHCYQGKHYYQDNVPIGGRDGGRVRWMG